MEQVTIRVKVHSRLFHVAIELQTNDRPLHGLRGSVLNQETTKIDMFFAFGFKIFHRVCNASGVCMLRVSSPQAPGVYHMENCLKEHGGRSDIPLPVEGSV